MSRRVRVSRARRVPTLLCLVLGTACGTGASGSSSDAGTDATLDGATPGPGFAVLTNRYDNSRTGANTSESTLTVANVGGGKFGLRFAHNVDGQVYAQPLYLPGLAFKGSAHNVVFVATEHNTVYAFDADATQPPATDPLWTRNLGTPADMIVSDAGFGNPLSPGTNVSCSDMVPKSGITSTPVIDPATGRMYVVGQFFEGGSYHVRLYALDVHTGSDAVAPVEIQGSVPGTGYDADGGTVPFDSFHALNRAGLLLSGGNVYIAFAGHCDDRGYHGWVFAYRADTLAQTGIFNTTPGGTFGSIWQSGIGLVGDQNDIYFSTGNGDFDTSNRGANLGLSVVHLQWSEAGGLALKDWWTATNAPNFNINDYDLTAAPVMLPNPKVLVAGGKDGNFYVLDPANLGKYNPTADQIVQEFMPGYGHIHGGPVYWNGPSGPTVYIWPEQSPLVSFTFNGNQMSTQPASRGPAEYATHPGGILTLSSNGSTPGTGILWATFTSPRINPTDTGLGAWHDLVPGALYAFDATNLKTPIWKSTANPADSIGVFAKFNPPTVANGKLYLGVQGKPDGGALLVYGLAP
jgi:hypothetical protein